MGPGSAGEGENGREGQGKKNLSVLVGILDLNCF